ncbi:hypothetical protein RSOLAG22IIIB_13438 [Rhizoctonia solani]|uniref:Uncharacterized protein n=1 Tax=Rhizoctonia solani TaxID=456999 RepID=A0A0K6FN10_9AGAM|nr:hypothetical protein RSOLAG22IIIB_13438 [Rhizoctonia solani]
MSDPFVDLVQAQLDESLANVPEGIEELDESTLNSFFAELYRKVTTDETFAAEFSGGNVELFGPRPTTVQAKTQVKDVVKMVIPSKDRIFTVQECTNPQFNGNGTSQTFGHASGQQSYVLVGAKGFISLITSGKGSKVVFVGSKKLSGIAFEKGTGTWN